MLQDVALSWDGEARLLPSVKAHSIGGLASHVPTEALVRNVDVTSSDGIALRLASTRACGIGGLASHVPTEALVTHVDGVSLIAPTAGTRATGNLTSHVPTDALVENDVAAFCDGIAPCV